jgi:hypothetical protein
MKTRKRFLSCGAFAILMSGVLAACNSEQSQGVGAAPTLDEDRYHEKNFSWDAGRNSLAKQSAVASVSARQTRFQTAEALTGAIRQLEEGLEDADFTDSLWKPLDYSCDELDLALWNAYGTVLLGDSVVFDEGMLKARCRLTESAGESAGSDSLLGKGAWKWWSETEVSDRQYPYKMIGRSWDDFNLSVYKSTGGETQFEKQRSRLGVTAWYDTDATRIGVRIYLFDCGRDVTGTLCSYNQSKTNWYANDDYTSEREAVTGAVRISKEGVSIQPVTLKISDAVYSMHSVDHAGLQFRASSSSGLTPETRVTAIISPTYVTW